VSGQHGREAAGQAGDRQGMNAGRQRVGHTQMLDDELAITQLQAGVENGCIESIRA
jgi:hypothetical protein